MIKFAKKLSFLFLLAAINFTAAAQKKDLTDDQYFKGNFKGITNSLPLVSRWVDDSHFILKKDGKNYIIDCKTGMEKEATDAEAKPVDKPDKASAYMKSGDVFAKVNGTETQLTNDTFKKFNPTISPDANYVAYTKNNDLYTINLGTKKETRITSDGSETILNGYASWVYTEEILGRRSAYRSFWWSPDSKHIAFVSNSGPVNK